MVGSGPLIRDGPYARGAALWARAHPDARMADVPAGLAQALLRAEMVRVAGDVPGSVLLWAEEAGLMRGTVPSGREAVAGEVYMAGEDVAPPAWARESPSYHVRSPFPSARRATVVLTRPWRSLREEALDWESNGFSVVPWPLTTEEGTPEPTRLRAQAAALSGGRYDAVAFASARAVDAVLGTLAAARVGDVRLLAGTLVGAVGEATGGRLREYGVLADVIGPSGGAALARELAARLPKGARVLVAGALGGRREWEESLFRLGLTPERCEAYVMRPSPLEPVRREEVLARLRSRAKAGDGPPIYLQCMSPKAARELARLLGPEAPWEHLCLLAVGETTEREGRTVLGQARWRLATRPSHDAVLRAALEDLAAFPPPGSDPS